MSAYKSPFILRLRALLKTDEKPEGPFQDRVALAALIPLAALLFAVAAWAPWYANFDVDTLTHFEQIRAVADHGTLGIHNGPVAQYSELRTRWFVASEGQIWGIFPATMPYLLALPMRLGGYKGVIRAIWGLFALGALMSYALTWRLTRQRGLSVAAAYALVTATSLGFWGTMTAPFIPASCLGITGVYFGSRAFDQPSVLKASGFAALCGLFVSCAFGCHLLFTLPFAAVGAVLCAVGPLTRRPLLAAAYGLASAPSLAIMAWTNHHRFHSWNPASYGPCNSHSCEVTSNDQTPSAFAELLKPVLPYVMVWALLMYLARRSPRATGVLGFMGAAAALMPDTALRETFSKLLHAAWGFVVDLGNVNMGFNHSPEGPGSFNDVWCVRALLQCSPYLAAAALAQGRDDDDPPGTMADARRGAVWMLYAVAISVLVTCSLRADTGGAYVWGWPFLTIRYTTPMLPSLVVLAAVAMKDLPWRRAHPLVALAVAYVGARWLLKFPSDEALARRQWLHWAPLGMALVTGTLVAAARARGWQRALVGHLAALAVAGSVGWSAAEVFGVDRVAAAEFRGRQTERTLELARCTPQRFTLLGGYAMDESLALHDHRDIYFINVGMGPGDGSGARRLIEAAPDRPAFLIEDYEQGPWNFHWPGYIFRARPECPRVREIVRSP